MIKNILRALIIFLFFNIAIIPQNKISNRLTANNNITYTKLNINNISTYYYNNGDTDINPRSNSGFVFPKNSGKTAIFESGLVWGTKIAGDTIPRVCGSTYGSGLQPGIIKADGTAADPSSPKYRIYRVRQDVYPGGQQVDLSGEAKEEGTTEQQLRTQYEQDWTQWPADIGAPYVDKNNNGVYDPAVDIPGVKGADQTLWYVANDLDSVQAKKLYGTSSIGMEMQVTAWAYNREGALGNTEFRKFKLINKSKPAISSTGITYDSMYVSYWSDPDLGSSGDDFVGTDTTNNFLYVYNAYETDYKYNPLPPPAIAYNLVQGPVVDSPGSTALFDGRTLQDKKNLNIISSIAFAGGDPNLGDPPLGLSYLGSIEFYYAMKGYYTTGIPMLDPVTKQPTTFYAPGDPITQSGWIGGKDLPAGDRRCLMTTGPFTMSPGDTQEVVYAITAGGGTDRLNSVKLLRYYNGELNSFYRNNLGITPAIPVVSAKASYDLNGINLNWGYDQAAVDKVENFNQNGYSFEGYNVYQLNNPESNFNFKQNALRLGTFDKNDGIKNISGIVMDESSGYGKPGTIQFGNDTGLKRSLLIVSDSLTNFRLIKGKPYYFAVTGYYYNPNKTPNAIENILSIFSVTYQDSIPGLKYADSLKVTHIAGSAGVRNLIYASIYNPKLMNGHTYHVTFSKKSIDPGYPNTRDFSWSLTDSTENITLLTDQKSILGNIIELPDPGIRIGVTVTAREIWGYKHGFSDYEQTVKTDPNTNPLNLTDYSGYSSSRANLFFDGGDQATDEDLKQDLEFRFTGTRVTNSSFPEDTVISSGGSIATIVNKDYSISKRVRIPFELWEVERNRRINVVIYSFNRYGNAPWGNDGTPLYYRSEGLSYIVPVATAYNPNATVNDVNLNNPKATWILFFAPNDNFGYGKKSHWDTGDKMVAHYTTPLGDGDVYSFTTPVYKAGNGEVFNPTEYKLYQNYPNPFNPVTSIRYNLPQKGFVNIKVYNILGQLVKTLVNKEMNKGLYQADFNAASLASGVYIYTLSIDGSFYYAKKMILMK